MPDLPLFLQTPTPRTNADVQAEIKAIVLRFSPVLAAPAVEQLTTALVSGGFVAFEHRGFRVSADVEADEQGVQWACRAVIERTDGDKEKGAPEGVEMLIARAKIDPLMAKSALEHRAIAAIDEWYAQGLA